MCKLIMGVGSGNTNLFVEGTAESIDAVREKLFRLERLQQAMRDIALDPNLNAREAAKTALRREGLLP